MVERKYIKGSQSRSMLYLLLLYSGFVSSCKGQDNLNQNLIIPSSQGEYRDPLFFIDGQLCQHLRKIFQDKKGDLWFGTNVYGLMRFNGDSLEYFNQINGHDYSRITGIAQDQDENIWFSSYQGLIKYDGQVFTDFTEKEGLLNNEIWSFVIDSKGIFWIGTNAGVCRFDGKLFSTLSIPKPEVKSPNTIYSRDRIVSIAEDRNGTLWFGTDGFGICMYNASANEGKTFTHFTTEDGLCDNTIYELMADSNGNMWIGTFFGGVSMYDGKKFTNFTKEGVIYGEEVSGFYEDKTGNIWFAAENKGVYSYNGKSFTNLHKKEGLITNGILSIFEDKQGRFWFGGWGGLFRYNGTSFITVTKRGPWNEY